MSGSRSRRPLIEALEPRMLFSATADIAVFDDGSSDPDYLAQAAQSVDLTQIYPIAMADDPVAINAPIETDAAIAKPLETLVVVDTSVRDYQLLVDDIRQAHTNESIEIIYIEAGADGIGQVTQALAQYTGIDSIHIISHGDAASVQLGTATLSLDTLATREAELAAWRNALSDEADILLYGCNIAATDAGRNLLDKLSAITQADIAASEDVTGHNNKGGDWDLEYTSGAMESAVILSQQAQNEWQHALAVYETSGAASDKLFVTNSAEVYQSFVDNDGVGTYTVNEIAVQMMRNQFAGDQTPQNITVSLISGSYNGTVLAASVVSSSDLNTAMSWEQFSVGSLSLNYGETYYIKVSSNSASQLVELGVHNSDVYAGGNYISHFGVADNGRDLAFEVSGTNAAPTVANPISDQSATEEQMFNFQFAANTFNDTNGDTLTYTAELAGGSPLPAWLSFDAVNRTFSGVPDDGNVGILTIEVTADDGNGGTVTDSFQLEVVNVNDDPFLNIAIPDQNATEDSAFNYTFPANTFGDGDIGASFTYTAELSGGGALPAWLSFDSATRTFSGTPANGDVGTISIEVTVDDGAGGTASDTFDLTVANTNDAPTIANAISDQNATEATAFNFQFPSNTFNDADAADTLTYTAELSGGGALPAWLSFDAATRTFSGVPATADIGSITIEVTADDSNGGTVTDSFTLTVAALDDTNYIDTGTGGHFYPVSSVNHLGQSFSFDSAGSTYTVNEISLYLARYGSAVAQTITVELRDAWNGAVIATDSIASSQISDTGFEWHTFDFSNVTLNDNQTYVIQISTDANDDSILVSRFDSDAFADGALIQNGVPDAAGWDLAFKISKEDGNNTAPSLDNPIADQVTNAESPFNLVVPANTFSDADANDTLTYRAQLAGGGSLDWLTFNEITRTFSGTPHWHQAGTMQVELIATDNHGASTSDIFEIEVINTNTAPTVANPIPDQNATEDAAFNFQFASNTFDDVDVGNTFTYTAQLAGGGGLPPWLSFDAATRTFSGTPANADVGTLSIEVIANDGFGGTVTDTFSLVVGNTNDAPTLANAIPNQNATEDTAFNFQFALNTFNDQDVSDTLSYAAQLAGGGALPTWLSFDAATRTFSGTPANGDVGTITIDVIADDGNGGTISDTFDIVIANSNDAPTVANVIPNQNATEDAAFNFQFAANTFADADLDALSYTAQLAGGGALPTWLSFDAATRTFSGIPANGDVGTISIDVIADDGNGGTITDTFDIVIANSNDAPTVANAIPNQNAAEDAAFNFQFAANTFADADLDVLTYTAQLAGGGALPTWLSFDAATRTFSGTPANGDIGTISIDVIADDGNGGTVTDTFDIVIANSNDAPTVANAIPNQNANEDAAFNFQFAANTFADADLDILSYTAQLSGGGALPAWLSFDAATRTFSGTPANGDVGTISIEVTADDGNGGTITDTFDIVVANSNDAPTIANAIPNQNATEDAAFNFQFAVNTFADVDLDALSYTAQLAGGGALPTWLSFDAVTRTFSGIPANGDVGTITIDVIADDGNGGTITDTFDIVIANTNDAPTAANAIPNQNATEDAAFNFQFAANTFADVDLDTLSYTAQLAGGSALPTWLSFDAATRTFSGTPANGDVGTISIDVIADDGNGGTITDTFDIVIANTNDAPTVANVIPNQNATEDTAFNFQFAANTFADADLDALTYSAQLAGGGALPTWLSFDAATRTFSGTPANGDVGTISIDVIADDGNGGTVTDTFDIVIANSNDAPTVANVIPNQNATEDAAFNFQFAANTFADADLDALSYTAQIAGGGALPTWLSFDAVTRMFSGTPANGDVGTISIDVIADDGNGGTITDTFDIVIANSNDAPTIANAIPNQNATEDAAFNFQFAANTFADADLDTLSYSAQVAGGGALPTWLSFDAATRTFSGTPANGDVGTISIDVIADDGNGGTITDTFDIVIANSNDAPTIANAIPNQNATEDAAFNFQFAANTFADADIDVLSYTVQLAGGGALPTWLSFDAVTRTFSGTPANADVGTISIEVTADDGNGGTITDTFDIVIANSNDAPTVANAIPNQNATEDTAFNFQFAANTFADADLDALTYSAQLAGGSALPTWLSFDAATRTFSGTPANGDVGTISIDVIADDGNGGTVTDTFDVVVANSNDAPTAANAIPNQNATEDTAFNFQFAANTFADADLDALSYTAQLAGGGALPTWLSFDAATRTFSGTPANGDVGTISIDVIADDGNGGTITDTFDIVIANTNDAPTVANAIPNQNATEDTAFNFQFAANTFADADLDALSYTAQLAGGGALPTWLSFDAATRTFSGTPANGDVGTISIDVIADDGNGGTITDTFDIVIANSNDAPTVANVILNQNATEDAAFNFQFAANTFADADLDTLSYTAQLAGGGALPIWLSFDAATRTFSGTPANGDVGTISIDVIADDGNGGTVTDTFDVVVANSNDVPTIANVIPNQNATEDTAFNFQFAANTFADADLDALTYSAQSAGGGALPAWLSFDAATRTFSGTPANGDVGTISIDVIADDGNGGTVTDTFDIVVANSNDAPTVANVIPNQNATEDAAFNFQFAANTFADADLDALSYTAQLAGGGALPTWLSFDAATRTFSGTPANGDVGTITIDVIADDGNGGTVTDTFDIVVANSNDAPTVANAIPNQNATEDTPFNFSFPANTFYDLDAGDVLTYTVQLAGGGALPSWLNFDAATRTFSGTPANADVGMLVIDVIATDSGGESVYDSFDINVAAVNDAPTTSGLSTLNILEDATGNQLNLWSAFDDQEDSANNLTYTVISNTNSALVIGATIDQSTGQLQLSYGANQFGTAELVIRAQDSQGAIVETPLVINIASVNDNPLANAIADIETTVGQAPLQLNLRDFFNDVEDGTNLTYSIQSNSNTQIVPQIQIDQATGQMTLVFAGNTSGETTLVLRAQDSAGAWVDVNFTVTLVPVATQPGGENPGTEPPDTVTPPVTQPPIVSPPVTNPPVEEPSDNEEEEEIISQNPPEQTDNSIISNPGDSSGILVDDGESQGGFAQADDKSSRDYQRYEQLQGQSSNELDLLGANAGAALISPDTGFMPWELEDFDNEMRRMREQMDEAVAEEERRRAVVAGMTFSVTTGLLIWSLRASSLLLTLFSMLPLWRGMDPLPILEEVDKRKKELEQQRKDRQREDKSAKEVGYLFDNTGAQDQGNSRS